MIPQGWALIPIEPTERMLGEFAGCYWPHMCREKQEHERAAYAAMLAVCPTPPVGGTSELERKRADKLQRELGRTYSLLGQAQKRARA